MTELLTKKGIAKQLDVSDRVIREDLEFLKISPVDKADWGANLYSPEDVELVTQLRTHCKDGKTRTSFIRPSPVEITLDEPVTNGEIVKKEGLKTYIQHGVEANPLFVCEILEKLCDKGWMPPTKALAQIIGVCESTLRYNSPYVYWGFVCTSVIQANGRYLWQIKKSTYDPTP